MNTRAVNHDASRPEVITKVTDETAAIPHHQDAVSADSSADTAPQPGPNVFRREGEYWTIIYQGATCRLRDTRGMRLLQALLSHQGRSVPAPELVVGTSPSQASGPTDPTGASNQRNEQARVNATRAIKSALQRINAHHPELGSHLAATIRTGAHCTYRPDPRVPITWEL